MIFASFENNPIPQILSLPTPKKQKSGIKCIDNLITTTNFRQFSKDELYSLFSLLSNGQTLEALKTEYDLKSEIIIPSLSPLINENIQITDPNIKNTASFYILRCSITFLSQSTSSITSSSLKKMFQLLVYSIDNNHSNLTNLSRQIFLTILTTYIDKVNLDMLEILKHFFNIVDGYYDESLLVLTSMINRLLGQVNPNVDSFLLDCTSQFLLKAKNFDDVKNSLKKSVLPLLDKFDSKAISFLSQIISKLTYNEISDFLKKVPTNLLNYEKKPFLIIPSIINTDTEIFTCDIEKVHSAQLLPFLKIDSFDSSYNINFSIPQFLKEDYFSIDLTKLLLNLRNIVENLPEANKLLSQLFIDLIKEEDSKIKTQNLNENKLFDIAIMSLFVCNDDYLNLIILQSKIFAPNISTYEYNQLNENEKEKRKEYEQIFNARTICLQQMRNLFSIIFPFLFSFYQFPLFVGDIFSFLINDNYIPNLSIMTKQNKDLLLEQIYRIAGDYQSIQIRKLANQDKISYSRVEILFYILKLLTKEENSQLLINNALFMQLIVSFMCEEKLRPIVLNSLEEVLTKSEFDLSDCFSEFIKFIIIHNDDNKLKYDTLTSLNKIVSVIPDYKEYFNELVDPLIDSLNTISKSEKNEDDSFSIIYMKSIFKFVSLASLDSSISNTKKILSAIQRIEGDDPSDETFNTLLNVISGNNKKKYLFNFNEDSKTFNYEEITIKYPSILGAFLKAFQKSSKFIGILQMLKDSCAASRNNAIKCHEGKIDLLIIDIVKEFIEKNKNNQSDKDKDIVINALQLFSSIDLVSSSVEVVQNFFSLFNEVDYRVISIYQSIFYIILNDLTSTNINSFDEYLPLNSNSPVVQINGLNNINVNNGFSIFLTIFLSEMKNSSPKFFSLIDGKRNKIEFLSENKSLKIRMSSKNGEFVNIINLDQEIFSYNEWNQFILSFKNNNDNKFSVSIVTNISSKVYPFEQSFELEKNNLNAIFGGTNPSIQNELSGYSAIKSIGIYQIIEGDEIKELLNGLSNLIQNKTIATIDFLNKDNYLILSSNFSLQKINAKLVGPSIFIPNSFKNVFINNDMLFMIFPLIFQNNCKLTDGQKTPDFGRVLYMILFNVLNSSLKAQILFYKSKGVDCLTHVLSNDDSISFTNYQSIFQLFKNVKLMQLKMEIMNKILLNMNIWIHLDALSQLQIYRDWSRSLNTKYNDYTNRFINFGNLLRDLRTFYWFSPVEKNIIYPKRKEDLESKLVDIRSSILQILHTIAQRPELFGYKELQLLISHCTTCKDTKQVLDLLSFIRLIIVSPETPLRNIENIWTQFARLHSLLYCKSKSKSLMLKKPPLPNQLKININDINDNDSENDDGNSNESVILSVIDIFVTLHFLKIIENPEVNIHVSIIIDILPIDNITHQFFIKFFPFAMKYPEVAPLLFFLGMKMGETELKIILNKVNPDVKFSSTKFWDLYPILFGLKYGGEKLDFISKFLAFSLHDNWDQVYEMITLIGSIFNIDTEDFKSNFLCDVCDNIMETSSLFYFEYLHNYFDIALFHIFFRKSTEINATLNSLFIDSPFVSECNKKEEKKKSSLEVSKKIFFEKLINDSQKYQDQSTFNVIFGLRFDNEGHWLDRKLAIQLIQLSLKTKVQTFHNASSLLLAFLFREFPNDPAIIQTIQQLISKRVVDKPFLDFLMSIYQKETFSKKNHFECFEILLRERLNINNSILAGISNLARNLENLCTNMKEETIEINKICSNKKEREEENEEILKHLIKKHSISKLYNKEYQLNEDLVKTVTKDKEFMQFKNKNFDEIRQNFFSDSDCLVKYKEIRVTNNDFNNNENHVQTLIMNPIENNYFRSKNHSIKKEKSVMLLNTPTLMKYSSHFYDDSTPFDKINQINDENHINQICVNALYYPQTNPIQSVKVKFTVISSKIVISNKNSISTSIFNSHVVYKELDADEIKKMIFMPLHNMPIGIEIVTNYPKKMYYLTLVSNDALSILKTIASFKEFKNVLIQTQMPNFFFKSLGITKKWKEGRMSNFQYLMKLNRYSGRSFCNIDSYPIFPRLKLPNSSEGKTNSFSLRNLCQPINPNAPISDAFTVISLLKKRLPFKKEYKEENINFLKSPRSPRSPRRTPKNSVFSLTSSASASLMNNTTINTNNSSNINIATDSSSSNINLNNNDSIVSTNSNNENNNKTNNNNSSSLTEMTPEFFYDLKFFKPSKSEGNCEDEEEVRNSFDTIYKRRKLLENSNIADFIDLVWGIKRKMFNSDVFCFLPFQLFKSYHPTQQKQQLQLQQLQQDQKGQNHSHKTKLISFRDEFHEPLFVAHEMSSVAGIYEEGRSRNYIYTFVCVDKKSGTIYRVEIDLISSSITSKETWSKIYGNVFSSTKINQNQKKSNLFLGINLRSIFSSQATLVKIDTTQNDEEIPIELDTTTTTTTIDSSSNSSINRITKDDAESAKETDKTEQSSTVPSPDSDLTIVAAFSFSQKSLMMNLNDSLKKFSYRKNQSEMIDSEIVNGVNLIACDKEIVAAAGKMASVINIYIDFKFVRLVPTLRGKITALAASASFGIVAATTADGFLVILSIEGARKSHVISQKSVDLHDINEKHRNSTKSEVHGEVQSEVKSEVHGEVQSEVKSEVHGDLSSSHIYTPKKILITRKWGFIVVYSEIDETVDNDDMNSHKYKRHKSKLSPGSFKTLSSFLHHDNESKKDTDTDGSNSHLYNDEDTSVGVIDVFTSNGDFIRREFVDFSIRCWYSFSNSHDFDFITAADEEGNIYVFEAYYAAINKPIYQLKGKEVEFLFVEIPYSNVFAFSNNGDVDVIPIPNQQ